MSKYLNRLAARVAREALRESAKESKNWIVSKKLILETEEMDVEFEKGDVAEIGATPEGDMAIQGQAAVVVISDADLAAKIADVVVSSDELSDVNFVEKPALDAVMGGEEVEDVIDSLADDDNEEVEVAELDVEQKESVEAKFAKFSTHRINPERVLACESILVDESDEAPIHMSVIKADRVMRESMTDYAKFAARVSEMKGSLQPGAREIALSESGKVIGAFNKEANSGILFLENEFDSAEAMDGFDVEAAPVMEDFDFGVADFEDNYEVAPEKWLDKCEQDGTDAAWCAADLYDMTGDPFYANFMGANPDGSADKPVSYEMLRAHMNEQPAFAAESCSVAECAERVLKRFEESAKSGADYVRMVNVLAARGLAEGVIAKIVATFDNKSLKECVRCFDGKYGKFVAAFKESVDCDNFIAETKEEKRFSKRFFA